MALLTCNLFVRIVNCSKRKLSNLHLFDAIGLTNITKSAKGAPYQKSLVPSNIGLLIFILN